MDHDDNDDDVVYERPLVVVKYRHVTEIYKRMCSTYEKRNYFVAAIVINRIPRVIAVYLRPCPSVPFTDQCVIACIQREWTEVLQQFGYTLIFIRGVKPPNAFGRALGRVWNGCFTF